MGRLNDDQHFPTEKEIEEQLIHLFSITDGMALVHTAGQNIDRIVSIFRASKKTGRKLIIDLYTAAILEATGNEKLPQSTWSDVALYVPQSQRVQIKNNAWFELLKRHSANRIFIENLQQVPKNRPCFSVLCINWTWSGGTAFLEPATSIHNGKGTGRRALTTRSRTGLCGIPSGNTAFTRRDMPARPISKGWSQQSIHTGWFLSTVFSPKNILSCSPMWRLITMANGGRYK